MIKNVIFDVGNVLVNYRWRALMEELGLSKDLQQIFEEKVFRSPWWGELDHGVMEESEVLVLLRGEIHGYEKEFDLIWDNRDKLVTPYPYSVPWIWALKKKGLKVYLLSNYPKSLFALHTECGCFPFLNSVDGRVVSGYVKMIKPNPDIYQYLLDQYQLKPTECVFLDDLEKNIETARAMRMKGIVFQSYEQASEELNRLIDQAQEK